MELKNHFVQDDQGNKLPNAVCFLYVRGTENLVSGLLSPNGYPLSNPFLSDEAGLVQFAAPNGLYDLRVTTEGRSYRIHIQFNDVNDTMNTAVTAAERAEGARDAALLSAGIKTSIELGLASTVAGDYFSVPDPTANSDKFLVLYLNSNGVAIEQGRYPSSAAVQDVLSMLKEGAANDDYLSVADEGGHVRFRADNAGGFGTAQAYLGALGADTAGWSIQAADGALCLTDTDGFIVQDLRPTGTYQAGAYRLSTAEIGHSSSAAFQLVDENGFLAMAMSNLGVDYSTPANQPLVTSAVTDQAMRNTVNLAASLAVRGEFNSEVQRPVCRYNHILMYGQSLSTGYEGWPILSKVAYGGNLMFGNSPRPASSAGPAFAPLGGAALRPLRPVVQTMDGASILTDAQVAALAAGAGNEGESPEVAAVNFARKMHLQYHGLAADPQRLFVASNCGVAGRTIEQLSKGASPDIYLRLQQAVQGVKAIADAESATYCIPAIFFMQGEWNYSENYNGDNTKNGYKAKVLAQANIWYADLARDIAAQESKPAIITYQTGATYTRDTYDLAIGMAQWELSQEQRNWYVATPAYPYTDKGGHLDSNGYRWLGAQMGKVFHRVVTLGQNWKPLSPRRVTVHSREILIDFHVPCPPLVFAKPYVILNATDYGDKGFRVLDNLGTVGLQSVRIVSETQVAITLSRDLGPNPRVQYAAQAGTNGNGNLRDSDPTVSSDVYVYQEGTGQYAGANIADLINKPYPLHNWCIAFSLTPETI